MIETQRLYLREMTDEDFDALYAVLADSDVTAHYPYTFDEKRVWGWIQKNKERYRIFGFGLFAVVLKQTGEMIGDCGITIQNINGVLKPEIGYHIRKDCRRKGYAREAAAACVNFAFTKTPFRELYSYMHKTNAASAATARTNGFLLTEEYEDNGYATQVYCLTRVRWQERK